MVTNGVVLLFATLCIFSSEERFKYFAGFVRHAKTKATTVSWEILGLTDYFNNAVTGLKNFVHVSVCVNIKYFTITITGQTAYRS